MTRLSVLLAIVLLASFSSSVSAQDEGRSGNRGACRVDAQKLCANVTRSSGRGAVFECLAGQKDKLSDQCRRAVESRGK